MADKIVQRPVGRPREFNEEAVLEAAMDIFWRFGFEAASLTQLCKATGLHKGSLYQAFGGKHELFMKALNHYSEKEMREVESVISAKATPLANIRAIIQKIMDLSGQDKGCLMVNTLVELAPHDQLVKNAVRAFGEKRLHALAGMMSAAQQVGEIQTQFDPQRLAKQMIMTLAGATTMAKGILEKEDAQGIVLELLESWR